MEDPIEFEKLYAILTLYKGLDMTYPEFLKYFEKPDKYLEEAVQTISSIEDDRLKEDLSVYILNYAVKNGVKFIPRINFEKYETDRLVNILVDIKQEDEIDLSLYE